MKNLVNRKEFLIFTLAILAAISTACQFTLSKKIEQQQVQFYGAMRETMHNGKLEPIVEFDTFPLKTNTFGLGPSSYLNGELLIWEGKIFETKILENGTLNTKVNPQTGAPFFVFTNVKKWIEIPIPNHVNDLETLEALLDDFYKKSHPAFAFKIEGHIDSCHYHVVNLPKGSIVKNHADAHQGQRNFDAASFEGKFLGFYSQVHQGIFTHHDSHIHAHILNDDLTFMGHLERIRFNPKKVSLFIQK